MNRQLIEDIAFDLEIRSYREERLDLYYARVIYSALSVWMKYILLDQTISVEEREVKTKNYHYRRISTILDEYIHLFPMIKDWLYPRDNVNPIHEIRGSLIASGEVVESDLIGNITLASPKRVAIDSNFSRLIDLKSDITEFKYVGITKLISEGNQNTVNLMVESSLDIIQEFMNPKIYFELFNSGLGYDSFNPLKRNRYEKHWVENGKLNKEINLIRKRTPIDNYWDYALVLNKSNQYYQYRINDELIKQGFHLKLMVGIRQLNDNTAKATFKKNGHVVELKIDINLPKYEESVLKTYSWPKNDIMDKWCFIVPIEVWPVISKMFEKIGYKMEMI